MCGVGAPLADPVVRLILALKATSLALGHSGVQRRDHRAAAGAARPRRAAGDPGQGLGRRLGRSRAARPSRRLPARPGRDPPRRARPGRRPRCCAGSARRRCSSAPRRGWRCSTAPRSRPRWRSGGWFAAAAIFDAALLAGAMSVDAALGSDVPFDPRLNQVRGQPGQVRVAERQRALLAGSAIRASHLVDCERVQDPYSLRCQPQVMGACLDLLDGRRRHAGARGERRLRQSAGVRAGRAGRDRRDPLGRQLPRRAGRLRGRSDRARAGRDRLARRAPDRAPDRSRAERPAGLPVARARPQLGLHAGADLRRGARQREPASRPPGRDRQPADLGQPGGPRQHGDLRRAAPARDGRQRRHIVAIELLAAGQGIELRRPLASSPPLEAALAEVRRYSAFMADDRPLAGEIEALGAAVLRRELRRPLSPCCRRAA